MALGRSSLSGVQSFLPCQAFELFHFLFDIRERINLLLAATETIFDPDLGKAFQGGHDQKDVVGVSHLPVANIAVFTKEAAPEKQEGDVLSLAFSKHLRSR